MALLFMDSFDHYLTADFLKKWSSYENVGGQSVNAGAGRRGTAALHVNNAFQCSKAIPQTATVIVGVAYSPDALAGQCFLEFGEASAAHFALRANANGSIDACRMQGVGFSYGVGAVLGSTAAGALPAGAFTYIEVKVTVHDTTGSAEVRLNGSATPVINVSTVDTRGDASGTGNISTIYLSGYVGSGGLYDDIYICDGSGVAPWNTFLGECRVDVRRPTAEGALSEWTPSTGTDNSQLVDDPAPDGDSTYVSAASSPLTDTHVIEDADSQIAGVQLITMASKTDAGLCTIVPITRISGTNYTGTAFNPGTAYTLNMQVLTLNPATGLAWTLTEFNGAEFGYRRTA